MNRFPAPSDATVVVIGAGTAGCVVAGRLAEAGYRVQLLEAGSDAMPSADPRLASMNFFAAHRVRSRWWPDLLVHHDADAVSAPTLAGRGLGGSSAVNGLIVDAAGDDPALGPPDEASAARDRVRLAVDVPDPEELGDLDRAVLELAEGRRVGLARRAGERDDIALMSLGEVLRRDGDGTDGAGWVEVHGGVEVVRLEPRSGPTSSDGQSERWVVVTAAGERIAGAAVVLCAGTLHTPVILQRSGVGQMVGEGVQSHPSVAVPVRLRTRRFPTSIVCGTVADRAGIEVTPLAHVGSGDELDAALLVALMEPVGAAGTVSASPESTSPPIVRLRSFDDPADLERLRSGLRWVLDALRDGPLADVVDEVTLFVDGRRLSELTDQQLDAWIRATPGAHAHLTSSCAIGRTLDDDGQVHGAPGVFVADASAFPRIPRTGPHLPTIIQAERLVARWTSR